MITEEFKDLIRTCAQCGTCTASCPSKYASEFNIRRLIRHLQLDLHEDKEFLGSYPWLCAMCSRCKELCTEGLDIPALVLALRQLALKEGAAPEGVNKTFESIKSSNSPYVSLTRTKSSWADSLSLSSDADTLYWVGCTTAVMAPNIAKASADTLTKLGFDFKLLEGEPCCGEPLINLGFLDEARDVAARVVEAVQGANVKRLVTSCSGCYNTFTRLYPETLKVGFPDIEVFHVSQLVSQNADGKLKLEKPMTLAYHDPCTLGRHSKVYDAPRNALKSIEGLTLVEAEPSKEFSGCCGGGGGLYSLNNEMASEIAYGRLSRDVLPLGVDGLVTCCPVCYLNFKRTAAKKKVDLNVYDLAEIVSLSAGK